MYKFTEANLDPHIIVEGVLALSKYHLGIQRRDTTTGTRVGHGHNNKYLANESRNAWKGKAYHAKRGG